MVTEQQVTQKVIEFLSSHSWTIIAYDFPQSGTGFMLRPNNTKSKNKDAIIPDIVALKLNRGVIFENKDRFYFPDFKKIEKLRTTSDYSQDLERLFRGETPQKIYYGIAFPHNHENIKKAEPYLYMLDFLITVKETGHILIVYSCLGDFFKLGFDS